MAETTIAIDLRMIAMSGVGRYVRGLLPHLLERPATRFVLLGREEELSPYRDRPRVDVVPLRSRVYHPLEQLEILRAVPPVDVFFSPHFVSPAWPLPAGRRVITIHDVYHISPVSTLSGLERLYMGWLYRSSARRADRIITVSEATRSAVRSLLGVPGERVTTIHNHVDTSRFSPLAPGEAERWRARIGQAYELGERRYLLAVGNVKPHKNLTRLVEAFTRLGREDAVLLIVGKTSGMAKADPRVARLVAGVPNIRMTGEVSNEELRALYALAHLLVFPSLYEGFGYPPLEAMACGTPALVSDIPVLREICGDAAVGYFDPLDTRSLREALAEQVEADWSPAVIDKGLRRARSFARRPFLEGHDRVLFGETG